MFSVAKLLIKPSMLTKKQREWLWFFGLWFAGLASVAALAYAIRFLVHFGTIS